MKQFRSKNLARTGLIVLAAGALVFVTYGGQAYARDGVESTTTTNTNTNTNTTTSRSEVKAEVSQTTATDLATENETKHAVDTQAEKAKEALQAKREKAKEHLDAAKLKVCQNREKHITTTMTNLTDRGTDHLTVFTKIADRVEAFYTSKGKTVSNYDTLVADVNAKKAAVETAIANAKASGTTFSCTDPNPTMAAQQFKDAHAAVVKALQDYRTAIKNLIVAVKSVQSDAKASTTTDSSSTTKTETTTTAGSN
jgi:hypothetical protein